MITLQLSREEAQKLEIYLLITTKYRTGEVEALHKLHKRLEAEGETDESTLAKLISNAKFWEEQCVIMDSIQQRLLQKLTAPQQPTKEAEL